MKQFEHITEHELLSAAYYYYIDMMDKYETKARHLLLWSEKEIYEKKAKDCKIKADEIRAKIIQIEQNQ